MILRNWMEKDPATTTSDTLVSEALNFMVRSNIRALPVVDDGVLRGLVTRKDLQGCAASVARAQDQHETEYFLNRLRIKDIMIRKLNTVEADDTVEHAIIKGQRELIRNYPVVEEGRLVGLVSSYELFEAVSQILGADEVWCGITFEPMKIEKDTIAKVASLMVETGAFLHGIFTMHLPDTDKKRIILRFDCDDLDGVVEALKKAGYSIWEVKRQVQGCLAENGAKA